jgi:ABC-type spermidine/putrescine transport system permease subunit II
MPSAFGIVVSQINSYNIGKTMPALIIGINLIFKAGIFFGSKGYLPIIISHSIFCGQYFL